MGSGTGRVLGILFNSLGFMINKNESFLMIE